MTIQPVGRPKYDARQKLIAATRELLSERGYSAPSPKMILHRAKLGQGSLYYHFDGKEELAVATIESMAQASLRLLQRVSTSHVLEIDAFNLVAQDSNSAPAAKTEPSGDVAEVWRELVRRHDSRSLMRLLSDPASAELPRLSAAVHWWADSIQSQLPASHHTAVTTQPVLAMGLGKRCCQSVSGTSSEAENKTGI